MCAVIHGRVIGSTRRALRHLHDGKIPAFEVFAPCTTVTVRAALHRLKRQGVTRSGDSQQTRVNGDVWHDQVKRAAKLDALRAQVLHAHKRRCAALVAYADRGVRVGV